MPSQSPEKGPVAVFSCSVVVCLLYPNGWETHRARSKHFICLAFCHLNVFISTSYLFFLSKATQIPSIQKVKAKAYELKTHRDYIQRGSASNKQNQVKHLLHLHFFVLRSTYRLLCIYRAHTIDIHIFVLLHSFYGTQ